MKGLKARLSARESEYTLWQEKQAQHGTIQEGINALMPILETLPVTNDAEADAVIPENWRGIHDECVSLQSQLTTLQQQETLERERLQQSQAQFNAALTASCFADREAFLSALLDETSIRQLEQQKQTLENQLQQATALSVQASMQLQAHQAQRPEGLETDAATLQAQLHQLAQQLRNNTTHQGRSASSSNRTPITVCTSRRLCSRLRRRRVRPTTGAISTR